jgi:hypothetical protein
VYDYLKENSYYCFDREEGEHRMFVFRVRNEAGEIIERGTIRVPITEHGEFGFSYTATKSPTWFTELCDKTAIKAEKAFRLPKLFR